MFKVKNTYDCIANRGTWQIVLWDERQVKD